MHSAEEALHGHGSQRRYYCCGVYIANFSKNLPIQVFAIARRQRFAFDQEKSPRLTLLLQRPQVFLGNLYKLVPFLVLPIPGCA